MRITADRIGLVPTRSTLSRSDLEGKLGGGQSVATASPASSFAQLLAEKVDQANATIQAADKASAELTVGHSGDIHGTMLALEQADMEFRLLSAVRNKVIDAYREVMRMGI
jgi:flagellar hook-basal body complex protein FliE